MLRCMVAKRSQITLGTSWGNVGDILGKSWGNLGDIWGKSWGNLGEILGKSWGNLGEILGKSCENLIEILRKSCRNNIWKSLDEWMKEGSGWVIERVEKLTLKSYRYEPMGASSYIPIQMSKY